MVIWQWEEKLVVCEDARKYAAENYCCKSVIPLIVDRIGKSGALSLNNYVSVTRLGVTHDKLANSQILEAGLG